MHEKVLNFWFEETASSQWWTKDPAFDRLVASRFSDLNAAASRCELFAWRSTPQGRLAEVIILDQFSRNIFRGLPESFACDALALALSQEAVAAGADRELAADRRSFFYMPFMHSESLVIHEAAAELFERGGERSFLDFELKHKEIIERFGRYPHRNEILGRKSTEAEKAFLSRPGSEF